MHNLIPNVVHNGQVTVPSESAGRVPLSEVLDGAVPGLRSVVRPAPPALVRWAATSELSDPTPFLQGGEFLLTTGLVARDWGPEWDGYVARLAAVGVVAVGFGTGLSHATVPARLVEACRAHGVGLVEVPRETTFVAISRLTADLVQARRQRMADQALETQQRLTAAAAREDDAQLLRILATSVRGSAQVWPADASAPRVSAGPPPLDRDSLASVINRMRPQGLRASASTSGPDGSGVVHPLGVRARPSEYLAAWSGHGLGELERAAVSTAAALLSLLDSTRQARLEGVQRLQEAALSRLWEGDRHTAELLLAAARPPGVGGNPPGGVVPLPSRVRVAAVSGPDEALDDVLTRVRTQALPAASGAGIAGRNGAQVWVLADADVPDLASFLATHPGVRVGIGGPVPIAEARRSRDTARVALDRTGPQRPVVAWEDLAAGGVAALLGETEASRFAEALLGDLRGRADLLATLRSFLTHHGAHAAVAADLGVHRNTVRNRLSQIESRLGRSLDDPATRVDAWVALQAGLG